MVNFQNVVKKRKHPLILVEAIKKDTINQQNQEINASNAFFDGIQQAVDLQIATRNEEAESLQIIEVTKSDLMRENNSNNSHASQMVSQSNSYNTIGVGESNITSHSEQNQVQTITYSIHNSNNNNNNNNKIQINNSYSQSPYYSNTKTYKMSLKDRCLSLREKIRNIVERQSFEYVILFLILASTLCLCLEDVNLKNKPTLEKILYYLEIIFTTLFTIEMIFKLLAIGLKEYFRSVWNVLDFFIVTTSWASLIILWFNAANHSGDDNGNPNNSGAAEIGALRALRTLRAFRPLRAVSRWRGMRVVMDALVFCIPSIANVLLVCMLFWLVFAIMAVNFFGGKFGYCEENISGERLMPDYFQNITGSPLNRTFCDSQQGLTWKVPSANFDNVMFALISLFQVATFEGWMEIIASAQDATEVEQQPLYKNNSTMAYIFFYVFIIIGSFFILNLIVGVIIESFQQLSKSANMSAIEAIMTEDQRKFVTAVRALFSARPKKICPKPDSYYRKKAWFFVLNPYFEFSVFVVIMLNMFLLGVGVVFGDDMV